MKNLSSTSFTFCFVALVAIGCADQDHADREGDFAASQSDETRAAEGTGEGVDSMARRPCLKCVGCSTSTGWNACCDVIEVSC